MPPFLPSFSPSSVTGLTYVDLLGTADPLGIADDPLLKSLLGPDPLNLGLASGATPESEYPPLPPEQHKSIIDHALNVGKGGIQLLGSALDTLNLPGDYLRGAAAGEGGERRTGRQMLESWGAIGPNVDQGWWPDTGDWAGFAADIATDPLTYLTLGGSAIGKAGKIVKGAGGVVKGAEKYKNLARAAREAPKDIHGFMEGLEAVGKVGESMPISLGKEQLGGLFGLSLPGSTSAFVPDIAKGPVAQAIGTGFDKVFGLPGKIPLPGGKTVGTLAKGLFDYKSQGQFTPEGQMAAEFATAARRPALAKATLASIKAADDVAEVQKAFREQFGELYDQKAADWQGQLAAAMEAGDEDAIAALNADKPLSLDELTNRTMQFAGDLRKGGKADIEAALERYMPDAKPSDALKARFQQTMDDMIAIKDYTWSSALEKGARSAHLVEDATTAPLGHFPGYLQTIEKGKDAKERFRILKQSFDAMQARKPETKFVPRTIINDMLADPEVAEALSLESSKSIYEVLERKYGEILNRLAQTATQASAEKAAKNAAAVALMDTDKLRKELRKLGYETRGMTPDAMRDALNAANPAKTFSSETIIDDLEEWLTGKMGKNWGGFSEKPAENIARYFKGVHIADANLQGVHQMASKNIIPGGVPIEDAFKEMGLTGEAVKYYTKSFGPVPAGMGVAPKAVTAAKTFMERSSNPTWLNALSDFYAPYRDFLKRNLTLPFPSFLVRNLFSGQAMNFLMSNELGWGDMPRYIKNAYESAKMLKHPEKYKALLDEAQAWQAITWGAGPEKKLGGALESLGVDLFREFASQNPNPISFGGIGQNIKQGWADAGTAVEGGILGKIPGVKQAAQVFNAPADIGGRFNAQVEFLNRMTMYKTLRDKGISPQEASRITRELQVAYEELAPFEKDVMKNIAPFYTYTRKTIPLMLKQIFERPGGGTAQLIRASNIGREKGEFVPGYIGEGMSVNLGGERYLSQLGLPTDQFGELFATGPTTMGTVRRNLQKVGTMMDPLLKGVTEQATGVNLFSGRPLTELYQYPTSNTFVNSLLGDTPFSRFISTARTIGDKRKGIGTKAVNLLTGVKITDVSGGLKQAQEHAAKDILAEQLSEVPGIGTVDNIYVRQGYTLPEDAKNTYRAYRAHVNKMNADRRKEKKGKVIEPLFPGARGTSLLESLELP